MTRGTWAILALHSLATFQSFTKERRKKGTQRQKEKGEKSKNSDPAVCEIVINKLLHLDAVFPLYTDTPTQME